MLSPQQHNTRTLTYWRKETHTGHSLREARPWSWPYHNPLLKSHTVLQPEVQSGSNAQLYWVDSAQSEQGRHRGAAETEGKGCLCLNRCLLEEKGVIYLLG